MVAVGRGMVWSLLLIIAGGIVPADFDGDRMETVVRSIRLYLLTSDACSWCAVGAGCRRRRRAIARVVDARFSRFGAHKYKRLEISEKSITLYKQLLVILLL